MERILMKILDRRKGKGIIIVVVELNLIRIIEFQSRILSVASYIIMERGWFLKVLDWRKEGYRYHYQDKFDKDRRILREFFMLREYMQ